MPSVLPIPLGLWGQMSPAAQAAILALVQQDEERLRALQRRVGQLPSQGPYRGKEAADEVAGPGPAGPGAVLLKAWPQAAVRPGVQTGGHPPDAEQRRPYP